MNAARPGRPASYAVHLRSGFVEAPAGSEGSTRAAPRHGDRRIVMEAALQPGYRLGRILRKVLVLK
jgi:hypothetical protein